MIVTIFITLRIISLSGKSGQCYNKKAKTTPYGVPTVPLYRPKRVSDSRNSSGGSCHVAIDEMSTADRRTRDRLHSRNSFLGISPIIFWIKIWTFFCQFLYFLKYVQGGSTKFKYSSRTVPVIVNHLIVTLNFGRRWSKLACQQKWPMQWGCTVTI